MAGSVFAFLFYFSGMAACYLFFRRKLAKSFRLAVLTYHQVNCGAVDRDIGVSLNNFIRQMDYLSREYDVISAADLSERLNGKDLRLARDTVVITFDDGYGDNYSNALPVLRKYGLPAVVFLIVDKIGAPGMLGIDAINEMSASGISFGSHTFSHPVLSGLSRDSQYHEINGSKSALEDKTGKKVDFFAFPKGKKKDLNSACREFARSAGYKLAFTTENGSVEAGNDLFDLKRIGIRDCPLFVFKARLSGIFESKFLMAARKLTGIS